MVHLGLYTVDVDYVKHLYSYDKEVFLDENYETKPYFGILVLNNNFEYFIPLTSAKEKHLGWKNKTDYNLMLYEICSQKSIRPNWIYKNIPNGTAKHIMSVLEIRKMIPVVPGAYHKTDFTTLQDESFRYLLMKEYQILRKKKVEIEQLAQELYNKQITTKKILPFHCNYELLEKASSEWHNLSPV